MSELFSIIFNFDDFDENDLCKNNDVRFFINSFHADKLIYLLNVLFKVGWIRTNTRIRPYLVLIFQ